MGLELAVVEGAVVPVLAVVAKVVTRGVVGVVVTKLEPGNTVVTVVASVEFVPASPVGWCVPVRLPRNCTSIPSSVWMEEDLHKVKESTQTRRI